MSMYAIWAKRGTRAQLGANPLHQAEPYLATDAGDQAILMGIGDGNNVEAMSKAKYVTGSGANVAKVDHAILADSATVAGSATTAEKDADSNVISTTYAKLASPALTGTPTAPTATAGDSSTAIATTGFVDAVKNILNTAINGKITNTPPTFTDISTFSNSFVSAEAGRSRYTKDAFGFVHIEGYLKSGTIGYGNTLFTLPTGFRPATEKKYLSFVIKTDSGQQWPIAIQIGIDGAVTILGALSYDANHRTSIDGISFYAG